MPDLNEYAPIIEYVFSQISMIFKEETPYISICNIRSVLDADTCAEIIQIAKKIVDKQ